MSIAGPLPLSQYPQPAFMQPVAPALPAPSLPAPQYGTNFNLDRFQRQQTEPVIRVDQKEKASLVTFHPFEFNKFQHISNTLPSQEGLYETLYMFDRVNKVLSPPNRAQFKKLMKEGVLQSSKAEDGHSGLYHLYAMLTTRRAPGYDPKALVNETVDILSRPQAITQKFAPLSENAIQKILMVRNYPESNRAGVLPPSKLLTRNDLNVESSGTCVSSSVMYYMADREPSELARHLNELTSPLNAFFEKVRFEEISPENPAQALNILNEAKVSYQVTGPNQATVKVNLPPAGALRAIDSQYAPLDHRYRNGVETAYQSALTFLANNTYDPAIDKEDTGQGDDNGKGLTEPEKSLMETIVKENGGVQSVTYQAVDGKAVPAAGEENNSYLYGYNRPFEKTTNDIIQCLNMKEPVVVGTTDTDETGAIVTGHEITITGYYNDPITHQLMFIVADSDDKKPDLVTKSARELIPTIHHAGLPVRMAQRINQEINNVQGVLIPDSNDESHFQLLQRQEGPMPSAQPQPEASLPQAPQVIAPNYATQPNPFVPTALPAWPKPSLVAPQNTFVPFPMKTGFSAPIPNNPWAQPMMPMVSA